MSNACVGVIGGTGLYDMEGLSNVRTEALTTPYGEPSGEYLLGTLHGVDMVFLPRHGKGHRILPHEINYRANVWGMKKLGVSRMISVSAVGSMREDIAPGKIVFVEQFFDRTKNRECTFFGDGVVAHAYFADPVCQSLAKSLHEVATGLDIDTQYGGTYICMEGPQFSTRAESRIYRSWGVDVIGMTNLTEAKLAREAEMCFSTMALATDYDCWHESEEDVQVEEVLKVMAENGAKARSIIGAYVQNIPEETGCSCHASMKNTLLTPKEAITPEVRERVELLLGKYL